MLLLSLTVCAITSSLVGSNPVETTPLTFYDESDFERPTPADVVVADSIKELLSNKTRFGMMQRLLLGEMKAFNDGLNTVHGIHFGHFDKHEAELPLNKTANREFHSRHIDLHTETKHLHQLQVATHRQQIDFLTFEKVYHSTKTVNRNITTYHAPRSIRLEKQEVLYNNIIANHHDFVAAHKKQIAFHWNETCLHGNPWKTYSNRTEAYDRKMKLHRNYISFIANQTALHWKFSDLLQKLAQLHNNETVDVGEPSPTPPMDVFDVPGYI